MVASGCLAVNLSIGRIFLSDDESPVGEAEGTPGDENVTPVTESGRRGPGVAGSA